jgi:hypothetical protein
VLADGKIWKAYARIVPSLTRDEATDRARLLSVQSYDIDLDLTGAAAVPTPRRSWN